MVDTSDQETDSYVRNPLTLKCVNFFSSTAQIMFTRVIVNLDAHVIYLIDNFRKAF